MKTEKPTPWQVLLPVGIGTGLSLIGDSGLYTVLPTHTADAGVMLVSVGILLSANRWVRLISNSGIGWISDRLSRRWVFVPALFFGALSTGMYALTEGFWPLLIARLLWGISWSGIWVSGNAIVFDISNNHNRGRWVGFYQVSFFSGAGLGSMVSGVLTDTLGYHGAMGVAAGLTTLGALTALIFLPETRHNSSSTPELDSEANHVQGQAAGPIKIPEFVSVTALLGINRIVIPGILISTFGVFLLEKVGESVQVGGKIIGVATLTGLGLGLSTFMSMIFTPLVGGLSDRFRNRWQVAVVGLLSGIIGFSLLAGGKTFMILLGLPLIFLASSSNQGLSTVLLGDLSQGRRHGRLLGILFTVGDLGSAIGPPLAYGLIPFWHIQGVYWLAVGFFGLMLLVAIRWAMVGRRGNQLST